jgi:hypothetical protein
MRVEFGKPIKVTAGVRCSEHNYEVGGAEESRHLPRYADAIDISVTDSTDRYRLIALAIKYGVRVIEVAPLHIHLDQRPTIYRLILGTDH